MFSSIIELRHYLQLIPRPLVFPQLNPQNIHPVSKVCPILSQLHSNLIDVLFISIRNAKLFAAIQFKVRRILPAIQNDIQILKVLLGSRRGLFLLRYPSTVTEDSAMQTCIYIEIGRRVFDMYLVSRSNGLVL